MPTRLLSMTLIMEMSRRLHKTVCPRLSFCVKDEEFQNSLWFATAILLNILSSDVEYEDKAVYEISAITTWCLKLEYCLSDVAFVFLVSRFGLLWAVLLLFTHALSKAYVNIFYWVCRLMFLRTSLIAPTKHFNDQIRSDFFLGWSTFLLIGMPQQWSHRNRHLKINFSARIMFIFTVRSSRTALSLNTVYRKISGKQIR